MQQIKSLIRLPEVLNQLVSGKAWIYRLISEGRFPAPVKIGTRAVAFVESEIDEWIKAVISNSKISCSVTRGK
ncbi:helix-turn-helix transcriptional regulator [Escherichia coli]